MAMSKYEPGLLETAWGNIAVEFATEMARTNPTATHPNAFPTAELAGLRRMDPDNPQAAGYFRLMSEHNLLGNDQILERNWALVLHGIALMTPTHRSSDGRWTAHEAGMPVGKALYIGGDPARTQNFYSETRLNRLLRARDQALRKLLERLFRMLGSAGRAIDWREMAAFILNQEYNEEEAERCRRRIAEDYYSTQAMMDYQNSR